MTEREKHKIDKRRGKRFNKKKKTFHLLLRKKATPLWYFLRREKEEKRTPLYIFEKIPELKP